MPVEWEISQNLIFFQQGKFYNKKEDDIFI